MLRIITAAAFIFGWAVPALADALDGDWCDGKRLHLSIKGPMITTPSGATLRGDYRRHAFDYVAPEGDPDAGLGIEIRQLSEDYMNFSRVRGGVHDAPELWKRCQMVS